MRRITYWVLSTVSAVVLLFSYHTSTSGTSTLSSPTSVEAPVTGTATPTKATRPTSKGTAKAKAEASNGMTVTGSTIQTERGPVQVRLTLVDQEITHVSVIQYPDSNGRDAQINSYALPTLIKETLATQSAHIDMVSGATVTSDGYVQSLQSALDQAGA